MYRIAIALGDAERATDLARLIAGRAPANELEILYAGTLSAFNPAEAYARAVDVLLVDTVFDEQDEGIGGIEFVARHYPPGCHVRVVYVTRHLEHATAVYRTQHVYFLTDPVAESDLNDALMAALRVFEAASSRPLAVRVDGKVQVIQPHRIQYIESDRRKLHIHVGGEVLTTYATLDSMCKALPASFVRCHKSFLVNMRCIESIGSSTIALLGGATLPVSQKRRKATRDAFEAYMNTPL